MGKEAYFSGYLASEEYVITFDPDLYGLEDGCYPTSVSEVSFEDAFPPAYEIALVVALVTVLSLVAQ